PLRQPLPSQGRRDLRYRAAARAAGIRDPRNRLSYSDQRPWNVAKRALLRAEGARSFMRLFKSSISGLRARAERSLAIMPMMARVLLAGTASSMLTTSVSLFLSGPGIDPRTVQMVLTAYPIGFLLGCVMARPLVSRVGHERSF